MLFAALLLLPSAFAADGAAALNFTRVGGLLTDEEVQTSIYTKEPPSPTYTLDPDYGLNFICSEASRIIPACGNCGPYWGDLAQCQALCDGTAGCTAITFFSDNGCRLYSTCSAADPCPFCVATSIYMRESV